MCFKLVPTAPPANVTAYNTSSMGIIVFWEQIPRYHRNGYILGYKVCYKRADTNNSVLYCTAVFALGLELGGLQPYTPYWITVLGYNNQGEGPTSQPQQVWTDEFGKLQWILWPAAHMLFWRTSVQYSDRVLKPPYWIPEIKGNLEQRNNSPPKKDERRLIWRASSGYQILQCPEKHKENIPRYLSLLPSPPPPPKHLPFTLRLEVSKGGYFSSNVSASHNLVSLSVPSVAPKITSLTTNSTAIRVAWEPIPEEHVNGVLRGYYVIYWRMPRVSQDNHVIQVNQTTLNVVIVGLKRNTSYGVQLTGLTRVRGYIRNGYLSRTKKVTTKYGKERFVISKH